MFPSLRRRSPSVRMPTSCAFELVTPVTPSRFEVISKSAFLYNVVFTNQRQLLAAKHQIFNPQDQLSAQNTAGMAHGEIRFD